MNPRNGDISVEEAENLQALNFSDDFKPTKAAFTPLPEMRSLYSMLQI